MRRWLTGAHLALFVVLLCTPALPEEGEERCSDVRSEWQTVFETLNEKTENLATIKQEPIRPVIERRVEEKKAGWTMARIVHSVLQERRNKIASAMDKVRQLSEREENAFSTLRRCMGRRQFKEASRSDPDLAKREKLARRLSDLLAEEAYLQYKDQRGDTQPGRSTSYRQYTTPYGPSPYGYGPRGYFPGGGPPPGYSRYR